MEFEKMVFNHSSLSEQSGHYFATDEIMTLRKSSPEVFQKY